MSDLNTNETSVTSTSQPTTTQTSDSGTSIQQPTTTNVPSQDANGNGTTQPVDNFQMPTPDQIKAERAKLAKLEKDNAEYTKVSQSYKVVDEVLMKDPEAYTAFRNSVKKIYGKDIGDYPVQSNPNVNQLNTNQPQYSIPNNQNLNIEQLEQRFLEKAEQRFESIQESKQGWSQFVSEFPEMNHTGVNDPEKVNQMATTYNQMKPLADALYAQNFPAHEAYRRAYLALHPEKVSNQTQVIQDAVGRNSSVAAATGAQPPISNGNTSNYSSDRLAGLPDNVRASYDRLSRSHNPAVADKFLDKYLEGRA